MLLGVLLGKGLYESWLDRTQVKTLQGGVIVTVGTSPSSLAHEDGCLGHPGI